MRRLPPITLWRHLLIEQWKLIGLTTLIVVTVISFAAAIKPLADGKLSASEVPKFMLLAVPPMLAYAIPFSAGFGATMAHHRLVQDNEMVAAHAGGISHRALLAPAMATGILLSGGLAVLNEQVIPSFLRSMQEMVTRDVARMVLGSVEVGQPLQLEDMAIYAENAWSLGPDAEAGAYERIRLSGLAVLGLGERSRTSGADEPDPIDVDLELTASQAVVWLFRARRGEAGADAGRGPEAGEGAGGSARSGTEVVVQLTNAYGSNTRDVPMATGREGLLGPFFVPGAFSNDPKFLTWSELNTILEQPGRMTWVQSVKRDLARALMKLETTEAARTALGETGRVSLRTREGGRVEVSGRPARDAGQTLVVRPAPDETRVRVEVFDPDDSGGLRERTRLTGAHATLEPEQPEPDGTEPLTFALSLESVRLETSDPDSPPVEVDDRRFASLSLRTTARDENLLRAPVDRVLSEANQRLAAGGDSQWLRGVRDKMVDRLEDLRREVISKRHERLAMATSALVMVLIGSIVAMRLRHSPPLIAYLWSFFPALASLLTISGGQQFVHKFGEGGLTLLWGGLLGLSLLTLLAYRGLVRH